MDNTVPQQLQSLEQKFGDLLMCVECGSAVRLSLPAAMREGWRYSITTGDGWIAYCPLHGPRIVTPGDARERPEA